MVEGGLRVRLNKKSFKSHRFSKVSLFLLLSLSIIGNTAPKATAIPSGHNFLAEIGSFKDLHGVDVDSEGRVFIRWNNTIWRSINNGATFTEVLNIGVISAGSAPFLTRVDSHDRIFTNIWNGSCYDLYRSVNHGDTWEKVIENTPRLWRLAEMPNGTLLINTYDTPKDDLIYKSEDGGASWSVWQNLTGHVTDHIHFVRVNPYNQDVWIGAGDQAGAPLGYHNGTAWNWIFNTTNDIVFTDAIFDENYVYLMPDRSAFKIFRLPHRGTWNQKEELFDLWYDDYATGIPYSMMAARYDDGVMIVPTDKTRIYGSIDGERWVKLVELPYEGSGAWRLAYISQRRPIYVADYYTDRLYRLDVQKEDIVKIFYQRWTLERGFVINQENYVYESVISNGTNHIDLTGVGLSSVTASIKGLSRYQKIAYNSGFESGWNFWSEGEGHLHSITSKQHYSGNRALNMTTTSLTSYNTYVIPNGANGVTSTSSDVWLVSLYAKASQPSTSYCIGLLFTEWDNEVKCFYDIYWKHCQVTTSWQRFTLFKSGIVSSNLTIGFQALCYQSFPFQLYVDSVVIEKVSDRIIRPVSNGDTIVFKTPTPADYLEDTLDTKDPILTIGTQFVSHMGTLTNGTECLPQNLTGVFTGPVKVEASIGGSGQAILRLAGTRLFTTDNIIFISYRDGWCYGRYYGTPSLPIHLSALINIQSNISALFYSSERLTLTIDSPLGATSTVKLYVGDKGKPTKLFINGVERVEGDGWNYDDSAKTMTITVTHFRGGTEEVLIDWRMLGDVNGDGIVDIIDLVRVAYAYGASKDELAWDADADFNKDNIVNILDLAIVGENYGKSKS